MKKFVTLILSIAFMLSSTGVGAFSDMKDSEDTILLSRLGIISGYEDGSFRPQNYVTRAETTAIIIRALGYVNEDISNYKSENNDEIISGFKDYDPKHWANTYIRLGIENGFISGFDDNTFRPDDPVTIAQLITMLTSAVGYGEYAKAAGGYPSGYMMWAASTGITKELGSVENNQNALRADVMTCVKNTLDVPLCVIDSYETQWNGVIAPVMVIKDSTGADFQSLLTHTHSIYTVNAEVLDIKKHTANILNAVNFDNKEITEKNNMAITFITNKNSENDIAKKGKYKMYIKVNDSDEKDYELICAFPSE